jgi:enoyl-CoA hydratase/carnithine racemase
MGKAEQLARTIAANGPLAVRAIKQEVARASGRSLEAGYKSKMSSRAASLLPTMPKRVPALLSRSARQSFPESEPESSTLS